MNCIGVRKNDLLKTQTILEKFLYASEHGKYRDLEIILNTTSVDVNHVGKDGKTALFFAINARHVDPVELLLQHGASVDKPSFVHYHRDYAGLHLVSCEEPPLVTAARIGSDYIVSVLLDWGAKVDAQSHCHVQKYHYGCQVPDRTTLHFACEAGNAKLAKMLLERQAEVNIDDKQCEIPLHIAVRCKSEKCANLCDIVQLLCEHGSDVDLANKIDCSPLYLACFYACRRTAEILLLYGADPNRNSGRESSYGTALHVAALKDRADIAELLIEHCAQLNIRNALGYTALELNLTSHSKSQVMYVLIHHGACMDGQSRFGYSLMATCIRNMRLDCEVLAKLMVYAGYDLRQDVWLIPEEQRSEICEDKHVIPEVPIPDGRVRRLCDWLRFYQCNTHSLRQLCRVQIRDMVAGNLSGKTIIPGVYSLPLPSALKDFLLLKDVYLLKTL